MFYYTVDDVKEHIHDHFRWSRYTLGLLNGTQCDDYLVDQNRCFMSQYIARVALGIPAGVEEVQYAYNLAEKLPNPVLTAWIVAIDFFHQIMARVGSSLHLTTDSSTGVIFQVSHCSYCDSYSLEDLQKKSTYMKAVYGNLAAASGNVWLLPADRKHGSCDLVWLQFNKKVLHCIQVINDATHYSMKFDYFKQLVDNLERAWQWECHGIEIYIAIPTDIPGKFNISATSITDAGALEGLLVGNGPKTWEKHKEYKLVKSVRFKKSRNSDVI
jgi:hypothetical protein